MSLFGGNTSRRAILLLSPFALAVAASFFRPRETFSKESKQDMFAAILASVKTQPKLAEDNRSYREAFLIPLGGLERPPLRARPSRTSISDRATALITSCEVSSPAVYENRYRRPIWPRGKSGITFGVGYDIGYTGKDDLTADWGLYLDGTVIDQLATACNIKGRDAKGLVQKFRHISVPWELARRQYMEVMQPRYVGITEQALPNFRELSDDSRGALVSLVYNRGASFQIPEERDPSNRYKEMREILAAMKRRKFETIPDLIRDMKRLWDIRELPGLHSRRDAEALLFEIGLEK
ncbi:hypothetical protein HJB51_10705 [Rhizobium lentis]|uniref:hypothetical protein n=1 Tax=Rhizobium lentis TaxID=1138194 RepID=UPI001C82F2C7|nr:hypothetical protein [Rhizobium lentis]MBX5041256.1 hypothetical protein [Rhizobium lentis]MBX5071513.1 hypothetical protein [Rhizobium lentis]MBX5108449.1 hypothetical protein [Rhizobium lentis]MBX5117871.1 hypothetical protein [Rhizobium lentis]